MMLTADTLRKHLIYDPQTGDFTRIRWIDRGPQKARAGKTNASTGYREIRVETTRYQAHRLAWLYMYGEWPPQHIDHINGVRHDNRICNLRLASHAQNISNRAHTKRSRTGAKGVSPVGSKYRAQIKAHGVRLHLGYFLTKELAAEAYAEAAKKHYGEFAFSSDKKKT